jgi:uncharacterized repeat protein (TIGR02543 family)
MKKYLSFLMLAVLVLFTACSDDDDKTVYTVTFETDGGTPVPSVQKVEEGSMVTAPSTNPTKSGYIFVYWHLSGSTTAYNFQTPVNGNFTLYAKWQEEATAKYWQVTWNLNGGSWASGDNHATQVLKGGTLAEPNEPTKSDYTFEGWYKESALTNKVTFPYDASNVTADFTLYAKWTTEGKEPDPDPKGDPVVYVSGHVRNESGKTVAKVWKDGEELYTLTDGTKDATTDDIFVTGSDVYVAGDENSISKVWKNGKELYSFGTYAATSVYVSGSDVYVAGQTGGTNRSVKVWKNGTELYTLASGSVGMSKICVSGSDVYVSGYQGSNAKVWKNGSSWWTSNNESYGATAHCVFVKNGNVYASFNFTSSNQVYIAQIYQGYTFTPLYTHGNSSMSNYTVRTPYFAISASGNVYAAVNVVQNPGMMYITQARIYKNDKLLYEKGGSGSMYLYGEDVYHYRTYNGTTTVSKNDTKLFVMGESSSTSGIFVTEK